MKKLTNSQGSLAKVTFTLDRSINVIVCALCIKAVYIQDLFYYLQLDPSLKIQLLAYLSCAVCWFD